MDTENNGMHVNPIINDAWKKQIGQNFKKLKIFQFRSVELQSNINWTR